MKKKSGYQKLKDQIRILEKQNQEHRLELEALVMDPDGSFAVQTRIKIELIYTVQQDLESQFWTGDSSEYSNPFNPLNHESMK